MRILPYLLLFSLFSALISPTSASTHHRTAHAQASTTPKVLTVEQVAAIASPSVVSLSVRDGNGDVVATASGFIIDNYEIATNYHVLAGASSITANFADGDSQYCFGVVAADKADDVAILTCPTASRAILPITTEIPPLGASVVAIGSPMGLSGTVSTGIVSAVRKDGDRTLIQTTAPISHGSSGGPLLNMFGTVVGMTSMQQVDAQNLNFAVSGKDIVSADFGAGAVDFGDIKAALAPEASKVAATGDTAQKPADSAPTPTDKPLTGLKGVLVIVEDLDSDARTGGLGKAALKELVKARLLSGGVTYYDTADSAPEGTGVLDIQVIALKQDDDDTVTYIHRVSLDEDGVLLRNMKASAPLESWDTSGLAAIGIGAYAATVKDDITADVNTFCSDYKAANPK